MTDRCTQYALDVVAGVIIAGEYVRLACQRHLDDLEKAKAAPYKYYFDVEKSEEIINFAEELTIAEGDEQENVTAYPFQCFILGSLNGWRTKEKGHRRFRTSYVQLGRQNGKSFINGILACYYGNFDGYKYDFNPRSHEGSDSNFRQKVLFSLSKNCLKYLILTTNYFN